MLRMAKDDTVLVTAGKDRGKRGKVLRVLPKENKVLVEGINVAIKHRRRTNQEQQHEGRVKVERPITVSSPVPARYILELPAGFIQTHRLRRGDAAEVRLERKSP